MAKSTRVTQETATYVYDLPYRERKELCSVLDINNKWEELGGMYMKFKVSDLTRFGKYESWGKSPTDQMLQEWGQQNNTVLQLFLFLHKMKHYQAMSIIKSCIPEKYHVLFDTSKRYKSFFEREGFASMATNSSKGAVGGAATMNCSKHTASGVEYVMPRANGNFSQQQSKKVDVKELHGVGGATAILPSSVLKYGPDNINHVSTSSRHQVLPPKVPDAFLNPTAPKSSPSDAKKKNNEISCEDNNSDVLQSKKKYSLYDPTQDYIRKVEEKRAKELANEEGTRAVGFASSATRGMTKSKTQGAVGTVQHPHPSEAQYQKYPHQEQDRRISFASDISRRSECIVLPVIPYKELEEATACWNEENILGRGGFGTVYGGMWKNTEVAVKKIKLHANAAQLQTSLDELMLLQSCPHENVLQVYGYSAEHDKSPCLVYQFMPNGSVEDRLQLREIHGFHEGPSTGNWPTLTWWQRYRVALGVAKALQYLHTVKGNPIIHGDVKSANILLDKNHEPKLGDFGLAREGKSQSSSFEVTRVQGTKPYLPAEYLRSKKLSVKVDTYCYGIVQFELCTGLRAYDDKRKEGQKLLSELVDKAANGESLRDKKLGPELDHGIFSFLLQLAKRCVQKAHDRPVMADVYNEVNNFGELFETQMKARKISKGETNFGSKSPLLRQAEYDTVGSVASPPPTGSPMMPPRSPVPSFYPSSSVHPLYAPHPVVAYQLPPVPQFPVNYQYGLVAPVQVHPSPQINISPALPNGIMGRDAPPSYNEAMSPDALRSLGHSNHNPIIPQLSIMNINSSSSQPANNPSSSRDTETSTISESNFTGNTTVNPNHEGHHRNGHTSSHGAAAANAARLPTVISNKENDAAQILPLLTEIYGQTPTSLSSNSDMLKPSTAASLSSNTDFMKPPTARNKKSFLD